MKAYEIGQIFAKTILFLFPLFVVFKLSTVIKKNRILILLFILGWFLYVVPMELRPFFKNNKMVLFWIGIIPSFGCAFSLPIVSFIKKGITYQGAKKRLKIFSIITFFILIAYELMERIKGLGTFDWLDITMSIIGLVSINILFNVLNLAQLFVIPASASVSPVPTKGKRS